MNFIFKQGGKIGTLLNLHLLWNFLSVVSDFGLSYPAQKVRTRGVQKKSLKSIQIAPVILWFSRGASDDVLIFTQGAEL